MAIDVWDADVVEKRLGGRTSPFVLGCSRKVGRRTLRISLVVKGLGLPEVTERSLFCELFGNLVAGALGIKTPAPAIVRIADDFATTMTTIGAPSLRPGMAVGVEFLSGTAQAPAGSLPVQLVPDAARIYGFDLMVQNPDRHAGNSNCFVRGGRVVAFDFEACFSFLLAISHDSKPWVLSKLRFAAPHLFCHGLREAAAGRSGLDWRPFLSAITELDDEQIQRMMSEVPEEWYKDHADRVRDHLAQIIQHKESLELELRRSLA